MFADLFLVEPITAVAICVKCRVGFRSLHSLDGHVAKNLAHVLARRSVVAYNMMGVADAAGTMNSTRAVYLNAANPIKGGDNWDHRLKPLPYLTVCKGFCCSICGKGFKGLKHIPSHAINLHRIDGKNCLKK